jgi:mono/diheme cytochrome c family protein
MKKILLLGLITAGLASCSYNRDPNSRNYDPNDPGFEYAPEGDMYYSVAYQPMTQYEQNNNPYNLDSMNMRMPVEGTIARGKMEYYFPYKNTPEDYQRAEGLANPYASTADNIAEGKLAYEKFCWQCHGNESVGKGSIVEAGKYPTPTWTFENMTLLKTLAPGKMFFTITYGKNLMGPHGHIVTPSQRWKIIDYLKHQALGTSTAPAANTAADTGSTKPNM